MKSVSIVYRRSKTTRDLSLDRQKPKEVRRAVDEYYSKLIQKSNQNREDIIDKIRSHTAKATRIQDRKKVFSSLSIAAIAPPNPLQFENKSATQRKLIKAPITSLKRVTNQKFFTLNLPDSEQDPEQSPIIFKRASKESSSRHAKLKILQKPKILKQVTLILSIDFIYNELNFWSEENINDSCIKTWKTLSSLTNLIWIVRRESSYRKLVSFAQSFNLRLDGVVQIQPNKKESLTISYVGLEQEMKLVRSHKLLIINCLRSQSFLDLGEQNFRFTLPVISHPSTFVHFAQIDINDINRFQAIRKIVSKGLPDPFPMQSIFRQHVERKGRYQSMRQQYGELNTEMAESNPPINVLQEIQSIKQRFLKQFAQSIGLTTKLENGDSINYLIGDMLRRNYQTAKKYFSYCHESSLRQEESRHSFLQEKLNSKYNKVEYNRNVYLWST